MGDKIRIIVDIVIIFGMIVLWTSCPRRAEAPVEKIIYNTDTLIIRDTVRIDSPIPVLKRVTDTLLVAVEVRDTLMTHDTVVVSLPKEQIVYQNPEYKAVISGYHPSLDSISVYPRTTIVTKKPRLTAGLQIGYGVTSSGLSPYAGMGVTIRLR